MDRFLMATNPLKPAGPTGLQCYIIDTCTNVWVKANRVHGQQHIVLSVPGATAALTAQSCKRAARWYISYLKMKGITDHVIIAPIPT